MPSLRDHQQEAKILSGITPSDAAKAKCDTEINMDAD
jgi:hypothetical protein